ncbi:MAG: hypothetical protein AAFY78_16960 [Cyanobacteria bacterium J06648_16]
MSRQKRRSRVLADAIVRLAGIKAIHPSLDVGNGLTVKSYDQLITKLKDTLEEYNTAISTLDQLTNVVNELEKEVRDVSGRMLSGVACFYGRDSDEYEMAGGTRRRERRRSTAQAVEQPVEAV